MERVNTTGVLTASDGPDLLNKIRDNIADVGWTILDDRISEDNYIVIYSEGSDKNNDRLPCYVRCRQSTTYLIFDVFIYWNHTTHVGYSFTGYSSPTYTGTNSMGVSCDSTTYNTLEIKGNVDFLWFNLYRPSNTTRSVHYICRIDNPTWDYIGEWQEATSPGSSITVQLRPGDPEKLKVGSEYRIISPEGHVDISTVMAKEVGYDQITLHSANYTLVSGTKIGSHPFPWISVGKANNTMNTQYLSKIITNSYSTTVSVGVVTSFTRAINGQTYSNDYYNHDEVTLQPLLFYDSYGSVGSSSYVQYCNLNPMVYGTIIGINQLDVGTTSTSSLDSLIDDNKSWVTDVFKDMAVILTTGEQQETLRFIESNTADTLNIAPDFSTTVSGGVAFTICEAFYVLDNKPTTFLAIKAL